MKLVEEGGGGLKRKKCEGEDEERWSGLNAFVG
jgi:hypothetical protein